MASPEVRVLYEGIVDDLNGNLARFEKLKRVLLVADEFSSENGTLTASMKLRRQGGGRNDIGSRLKRCMNRRKRRGR